LTSSDSPRAAALIDDFQPDLILLDVNMPEVTGIDILNYLGTCHYQLGRTDEALKAWTKSLELNPNQEKLKALVDSLKK
jgi:tetratricopeptide (TPR) repeat protein